jgi:hypothetical protein
MIEGAAIRSATAAMPWRAVAALAIAGGGFVAGWATNGWRMESRIERLIAAQVLERSAQISAAAIAVDNARREEQRRLAAQMEIVDEANKEAKSARMAARDADAAAERLRRRVADLVAARPAAGDSRSSCGGTSAGDPIGMLADVLGRADRRAGVLAEYADSARIAGQACERAYDALSGKRDEPR